MTRPLWPPNPFMPRFDDHPVVQRFDKWARDYKHRQLQNLTHKWIKEQQ